MDHQYCGGCSISFDNMDDASNLSTVIEMMHNQASYEATILDDETMSVMTVSWWSSLVISMVGSYCLCRLEEVL